MKSYAEHQRMRDWCKCIYPTSVHSYTSKIYIDPSPFLSQIDRFLHTFSLPSIHRPCDLWHHPVCRRGLSYHRGPQRRWMGRETKEWLGIRRAQNTGPISPDPHFFIFNHQNAAIKANIVLDAYLPFFYCSSKLSKWFLGDVMVTNLMPSYISHTLCD